MVESVLAFMLSTDVHAHLHCVWCITFVEIDLVLQYILELYSFTVCFGDVVKWGDVSPFR